MLAEYRACRASVIYFLCTYVHIYDKRAGVQAWVPFSLFPAQRTVARDLQEHNLHSILKARQLGLTWLVLGHCLHAMLFSPVASILLFSLREDEAIHLLDDRLKGMYQRLPDWLKADRVVKDGSKYWALSNGSTARAFSTTAGDSYAATHVLVDEADLVPNLKKLLSRNKPTIDGGGDLILLSRADKDHPQSDFKQIYRAAARGANSYHPTFLSCFARPDRDEAWYDDQCADAMANFGSLDSVHEQYPRTPEEALAPASSNKRLPAQWLLKTFKAAPLLTLPGAPALPGLRIYKAPVKGAKYVIGADPAEGLPTGDDSALTVKCIDTGESVAHLAGAYEPQEAFPDAIAQVATYFNNAAVLCERNNHGHAVLGGLKRRGVKVLKGLDGRDGWQTTKASKADLYNTYAQTVRDASIVGAILVHDSVVHTQCAAIDRQTLCHPEKKRGKVKVDDEGTGEVLAERARSLKPRAVFGGFGI